MATESKMETPLELIYKVLRRTNDRLYRTDYQYSQTPDERVLRLDP